MRVRIVLAVLAKMRESLSHLEIDDAPFTVSARYLSTTQRKVVATRALNESIRAKLKRQYPLFHQSNMLGCDKVKNVEAFDTTSSRDGAQAERRHR